MLRRAPHLLKNIKNVREHNYEGGVNNSQLNEDTDRSNLNSKVNYCFFRGHGNESCNLIGSLPGQYFPISAHGPR